MSENERLKELRTTLNLTMDKFAAPLGVGKTAIAKIESGDRTLTGQMIKSICLVYGVSEEWLKTGKGAMLVERSLSDELKEKIDSFIPMEEEDFRLRLVRMILAMDKHDMEQLEKYANKYLIKDMATAADQAETAAADAKNPVEMTREEAATELNRQYDTVEEGKSTAVQDTASGSFG